MKKRDVRLELYRLEKRASRIKRGIERLMKEYEEIGQMIAMGEELLKAEPKPAEAPAETVPESVLKGIEEAAAGKLEDGPTEEPAREA